MFDKIRKCSRKETLTTGDIIMDLLAIIIIAALMLSVHRLHRLHRLHGGFLAFKPATTTDYLFKLSRITGSSEYEIFLKCAEDWPVSLRQIDQDFKNYLVDGGVPYYVNDFVRRNRHHIDQLRLPPF